jgi:hypothetical protein
MVQDFTASPSTSTVHAPQLVVSQPMWVPVKPRPRRSRWASSSRGSTSATLRWPLTVTLIRRTGTSCAPTSSWSSYTMVMSGRPLTVAGVTAAEQPHHERAHHVPLVLRAAAVVGPRLPGSSILSRLSGPPSSACAASAALMVAPPTPVSPIPALVTVSPEVSMATATPTVAKSPIRRSSLR